MSCTVTSSGNNNNSNNNNSSVLTNSSACSSSGCYNTGYNNNVNSGSGLTVSGVLHTTSVNPGGGGIPNNCNNDYTNSNSNTIGPGTTSNPGMNNFQGTTTISGSRGNTNPVLNVSTTSSKPGTPRMSMPTAKTTRGATSNSYNSYEFSGE